MTSTASAVKAGGGAELWDTTAGTFNSNVVNDLVDKLFGCDDPVEYIKANGTGDYNTYGKNSSSAESGTPYYVVPASTINANSRINNPDNGLVVTLDGKEWSAASLTLADIGSKRDNVILTLYRTDDDADSGGVRYYGDGSNTKYDNMYSCSLLRYDLLTASHWSLFHTTGANSFAEQFLVQPKYVQYQRTETQRGRIGTSGGNYNLCNEALSELASGWKKTHYYLTDGYPGPFSSRQPYDAWGNDYIWLPSQTETGLTDYVSGGSSIWQLSVNQLMHSVNPCSWLRSGDNDSYGHAFLIKTTGAREVYAANSAGGVRPAIHLNLSAAGLGKRLDNPTNVTTTYNGNAQTLKTLYAATPASMTWYESEWYEHTGNYISDTYYDKDNTASTNVKDAGEYWVKVEVTDAWINAVNAEVDADGTANSWTAAMIASQKEARKPRFFGDPDTSDSAHPESDTVRWFKLTVNKKELEITPPSYNASTKVLTAPQIANASDIYADAPTLACRITGTANDTTTYTAIDTLPTKPGNYRAQAIFVDPADHTKEITPNNYTMKDASSMTCDIKIYRQRLAILTSSPASKEYAGEETLFPLTGYSEEWAKHATLTLPEGVTLKGSDSEGWSLAVAGTGEYEITATIPSGQRYDYCWDDIDKTQELINDRSYKITVTKKLITVDFLSSTGNFLLQLGASVTFTAEAGLVLEGDNVKLSLAYSLSTESTRTDVPSGVLDGATLPQQGKYILYATLDDTIADNKNYRIDSGEASQEITVSAKNITIDSVNWRYSENNGAVVPIASSEGASASTPFALEYTGKTFVFKIDSSTLAENGVKIDTSFGVGGYQNAMQTNAMTSPVAVTVRIIPLEESFAFNDESGNPLPNQYLDFTIYVQVNKARIHYDTIVWSADELEFNAENQSVSIVSGIPSFLNVTYTGTTGLNVGDYHAAVLGLMSKGDAESRAIAANYIIPTPSEIAAAAELKHDWKIIKKKIEADWIQAETTGDGDTVIWLPALADNSTGAVEYTYYAMDEGTGAADLANPLTLDELFESYDATTLKTYYVYARLKTSGGTYNATNCVLVDTAGVELGVDDAFMPFQAGGNKSPVRVSLIKNTTVYNGAAQPPDIEFEGNVQRNDFTLTYELDGAEFNQEPTNAGVYTVIVSLNSPDHAITGTRRFTYTIEKADYDLSSLKWVDTSETGDSGSGSGEEDEEVAGPISGVDGEGDPASGMEYRSPYTWTYQKTHTLAFINVSEDPTLLDGLTWHYSEDPASHLTGSDAGTYEVTVIFEVADSDNYNAPENLEFTWEIKPYTPDLSAAQWNYTKEGPFVFKIVDGEPVKYKAELTDLPAGLSDIIIYEGENGSYSDAGSHITSFKIDEENPLRKNFGELIFGAGVEERLSWEIKSLAIEKPKTNREEQFSLDGYTLGDITNLPADFAQYFDVEVYDSQNNAIDPVDGTWKFVNCDTYRILIKFKPEMNRNNGGRYDNVKWADNGKSSLRVNLKITPLEFTVDGWINGEDRERPTLDVADDLRAEIEKYFDYEVINVGTGDAVADGEILDYETNYTISLKPKTDLGVELNGNVKLIYAGTEMESSTPYAFQTGPDPLDDPPENFYRKPEGEELTVTYRYTGEEITFEFGDWFVADKMEVIGDTPLKGTEEGSYPVNVGFKAGSLAAWLPEDADPFDKSIVTITFVISKDFGPGDRFILKDGITVPFAFLYDDFTSVGAIEDYAFDSEKLAYVSRLALGDTLSALLSQFENGADITVYDLDGTTVITDLETVVATGMYLRLMDGDTMLNQLILSVLGEITGDGIINLKDKAQLNSYTLGTTKLTAAQLLASDITGDGIINLKDKAQLNSYTLGTNALPVTPITVPAPSSVSEVVENAEVVETPIFVSLSEVTEVQSAHTTSAEVAKGNSAIAETDHRVVTPQLDFYPHQSAKGAASFPLMCKGEAKRKEIF